MCHLADYFMQVFGGNRAFARAWPFHRNHVAGNCRSSCDVGDRDDAFACPGNDLFFFREDLAGVPTRKKNRTASLDEFTQLIGLDRRFMVRTRCVAIQCKMFLYDACAQRDRTEAGVNTDRMVRQTNGD